MATTPTSRRVRFEDKVKRTVALSPAVFNELLVAADEDKRSVSAQIEVFVEESLRRREGNQKATR